MFITGPNKWKYWENSRRYAYDRRRAIEIMSEINEIYWSSIPRFKLMIWECRELLPSLCLTFWLIIKKNIKLKHMLLMNSLKLVMNHGTISMTQKQSNSLANERCPLFKNCRLIKHQYNAHFFFLIRRVKIHSEFVSPGQTVNQAFYLEIEENRPTVFITPCTHNHLC